MRTGLALFGLVVFVAIPAEAQTVQRVAHPPPLEIERRTCELFRGTGSGNSGALVELRLCPSEIGIDGVLQWSSTESGWSQRAIEGRWEANRFVGHETRFIESRPQPGWRFCLIDRYSLLRDGARLAGTYDSAECQDHGNFDLQRVADTGAPVTRLPADRAPSETRREGRTDCEMTVGRSGSHEGFVVVGLALALLVRRRRGG